MSYFVIEGTFHVKKKYPDGDSLRFRALDYDNWKKIKNRKVELNDAKQAQLRMEAIDALETHYKGCHQPWKCAITARACLLQQAKITDIVWNEKQTRVEDAKDETKGYILTNEIEYYRRPVSFVFTGEPKEDDGSEINLTTKWLKKSINYKLIKEGLAYPTYYENLQPKLRKEFTKAVDKTRKERKGIWAYDLTNVGVPLDADSVTKDYIILPKLFRRIVGYLKEKEKPENFIKYLEDLKKKDSVEIISTGEQTLLSDLIDVENGKVRLIPQVEDLMFMETKDKPK